MTGLAAYDEDSEMVRNVAPGQCFSITFHDTTMYVEYAPHRDSFRRWRAMLPGVGTAETSLSSAIIGVIGMWRHNGCPTEERWCGPACEHLAHVEDLCAITRFWERPVIRRAFAWVARAAN